MPDQKLLQVKSRYSKEKFRIENEEEKELISVNNFKIGNYPNKGRKKKNPSSEGQSKS